MKSHIVFAALTALLLTACASHEGRKVSSTQEQSQEAVEYSKVDAHAGRDVSRQ